MLSEFLQNNPEPTAPTIPPEPVPLEAPDKPKINKKKYKPELTFWDKLSSSRREKKIYEAEKLYEKDYKEWSSNKLKIDQENSERQSAFDSMLVQQGQKYHKQLKEWKKKRNVIYADNIKKAELTDNQKRIFANRFNECTKKLSDEVNMILKSVAVQ